MNLLIAIKQLSPKKKSYADQSKKDFVFVHPRRQIASFKKTVIAKLILIPLLGVFFSSFHCFGQALQINELEYFETQGLNILISLKTRKIGHSCGEKMKLQ